MRFVHISDVHLGKFFDDNQYGGKNAAMELFDAFVEIIDYIETNPVDFLFITGDLFDHVPDVEEIRRVDIELARLNNVNIIYITGAHDYLAKDAPLWKYKFVSKLYLLNGMEFNNSVSPERRPERTAYADAIVDCIYFPEYDMDVYGICQFNHENPRNEIEQVFPRRSDRKNILLAYGGTPEFSPFDIAAVRIKKFDYVGLGCKHMYCKDEEAHLCYPGSLTPLSFSEEGKHGFIKGYMDGLIWDFRFRPVVTREYKTLDIKVDNDMSNSELLAVLEDICQKNKKCIYTINLERTNDCYRDYDLSVLREKFRIERINGDKSKTLDLIKLGKENRDNHFGKTIDIMESANNQSQSEMIGRYAALMLSKLGENIDGLVPIKKFDANEVNKAQKEVVSEFRRELDILNQNQDSMDKELKCLDSELVLHPDHIGDINVTREQWRKIEYDYSRLKFKDDQVDKIYNRRKIGFVTFLMTPPVLLFLYRSSLDVLATYFKANWMYWYDLWITNLFFIVFGIPICNLVYNKTKKLRKKIFKTPIPQELHEEYADKMKDLQKQMDALDDKVNHYREEQKYHVSLLDKKNKIYEDMENIQYKKELLSMICDIAGEQIKITVKN